MQSRKLEKTQARDGLQCAIMPPPRKTRIKDTLIINRYDYLHPWRKKTAPSAVDCNFVNHCKILVIITRNIPVILNFYL